MEVFHYFLAESRRVMRSSFSIAGKQWVVLILVAWGVLVPLSVRGENSGPDAIYDLSDAGSRGVFNIGPSQGHVRTLFDDDAGKTVWAFDYHLPSGTHVGVWTQRYPPGLDSESVDAVRAGGYVPANELGRVAARVEIKGDQGQQILSLDLREGWSHIREAIHWGLIGELQEVVFVLSPLPQDGEPLDVRGTMRFDLEFHRLSPIEKYVTAVKFLAAFLAALILAAMVRILAGAIGPERLYGKPIYPADDSGASLMQKLGRDFRYALAIVLSVAAAIAIHGLGAEPVPVVGVSLSFLVVGLLGALIAELWTLQFTGRHLTPAKVFQNVLVSSLLAAASSRQDFFQVPATWLEIFTMSHVTAAVAFLLYHFGNAYALATANKPIRPITAALFVGTPFLFGWLLIVQNMDLLAMLANGLTLGALAGFETAQRIVGRVIVLFVFNVLAAHAIGLAVKGRMLRGARAFRTVALVSAGVVLAPEVADIGSAAAVAQYPLMPRALIALLTTMFAFGGLWGQVYLVTGMLLDGGKRRAPDDHSVSGHVMTGVKKGVAYSAILLGLLYLIHITITNQAILTAMAANPLVVGLLSGALLFPLLKTLAESFDGSLPFFSRLAYNYRNWVLYTRGLIAGLGFAYAVSGGMFEAGMAERIRYGLLVGVLASAGVSMLRDAIYGVRGVGGIQTWRMYLTDAIMGAFIGGGLAFYLDARQVPVVIEKFQLYVSSGLSPVEYITYPLVNKWGRIDLGTFTGGARLLFTESLAGVINWSIAAWLFAVNKVFMQACFDKDTKPIRFFFSRAGFAQLMDHMIFVLRWGLWMSPIIFTFLRMMPEATWYNQDGAIRTLVATYQNFALSPEAFQSWSVQVFIYILAFDFLRVLIWMDHMGLRVATLVNLSFLGLDRLDARVAKFIGPAAAQRYIPEGVKRFATWAPLLIPFYLPRGEDWEYAWGTAAAMQDARGPGLLARMQAMEWPQAIPLILVVLLGVTLASGVVRAIRRKAKAKSLDGLTIGNSSYRVTIRESGEVFSELDHQKPGVHPLEYDVTRRAYDPLHPCGRILFLADTDPEADPKARAWPIIGNFPTDRFQPSRVEKGEDTLHVHNVANGVKSTIDIALADDRTPAEIWTVTLENMTDRARSLKIVPYLEWVLNAGISDRSHTQYARLFPVVEYAEDAHAVLTWQKSTSSMGVLASDAAPDGFHNARVDFIGRAGTVWNPRILETFEFLPPVDTEPYPTFDPIGSLLVSAEVPANGRVTVKFLIGYATDRGNALELVRALLPLRSDGAPHPVPKSERPLLIGHGQAPEGTPRPYTSFDESGNRLRVHTPFTPRPFDHALSNAGGHSVMVTNRGLHTSCNGNAQQNRLTPDWADTVGRETPSEAIYLYDPDHGEWFSPTYEPLRDPAAEHTCDFGVDGTAVFNMTRDTLQTELTVFVPPNDPAGVYVLKVRNNGSQTRRIRVSPYFQMVLAGSPEESGRLMVRRDASRGALLFHNPRNTFRKGWAFASMTHPAEAMETRRGKYFGRGRGVDRPYLVEAGAADEKGLKDPGRIAAFVTTLTIPAGGEETVAMVLGQADTQRDALRVVDAYKNPNDIEKGLAETRAWWLGLMKTAGIDSNQGEFDHLLNWLKYQALAERIWARRGFYQTSGAYGFRDQLQDTVNLMWVDPALARRQIILHAKQQFLEGDVFHWFFTLVDGRTSFAYRSHASDNLLWLVWAVADYLQATGDESLLDEKATYAYSEFPFAKLPKMKEGMGDTFQRTTRADTVYRHCLRSIDCVLNKRMGEHGLPLIQTGDWNDGLDAIGDEGRGESVWLGFFLYYGLSRLLSVIEKRDGAERKAHYEGRLSELKSSLEATWRGDRYLRAIHDDGTEIGIEGSGIWEIDALTAAWAVYAGINPEREETMFDTALRILERGNTVLLGWPALREDSRPYLGRSSKYPEGVRENGMYCHGVQWLIGASRVLAERAAARGDAERAASYRETAYRLWRKITPVDHTTPEEIDTYGGQPNKQQADVLTNFESGRMIWNGYTGAAGWLLRQAFEGVAGAKLRNNKVVQPDDLNSPRGELKIARIERDVSKSTLGGVLK